MTRALRQGLSAAAHNWGLALALLLVNLGLATLVALPLRAELHEALKERQAAHAMRDGFDVVWWEAWHDRQHGFLKAFGPETIGTGFMYRNLDLLLRGHLPLRLFDHGERGGADAPDPLLLGLGALALTLHVFLSGGVLSTLRRPRGGWKLRGLLHASGFYFGRLFRLALLTLALYGLVFLVNAPFARWADFQARDAVSETTALAWALGRRLLLALALAAVFVLSSYAKALVVLEERASALLALVSAAGVCFRRFFAVAGHAFAMFVLSTLLLLAFAAFDGAWSTTGYKTQLVALAAMQLFLLGRIGLRLAFLGGVIALCREGEPGAAG